IISISFSHLLNTNTSPASNSSSIASFRPSRDSSSSSLSRDHLPDSSTLHPLLAVKRLNTELVLPNNLPALAKYSFSILLPKTPLLNRQIDLAV
ncbi:hypothetical protein L249_6891, partial [Ophiocordyceps polyrhachis-furcata BCC 54312]